MEATKLRKEHVIDQQLEEQGHEVSTAGQTRTVAGVVNSIETLVMNTEREIRQAFEDYVRGRMGAIE